MQDANELLQPPTSPLLAVFSPGIAGVALHTHCMQDSCQAYAALLLSMCAKAGA